MPFDLAIPLLGIYSREIKASTQRPVCKGVYCNIDHRGVRMMCGCADRHTHTYSPETSKCFSARKWYRSWCSPLGLTVQRPGVNCNLSSPQEVSTWSTGQAGSCGWLEALWLVRVANSMDSKAGFGGEIIWDRGIPTAPLGGATRIEEGTPTREDHGSHCCRYLRSVTPTGAF